jgi:hypothetical protein
MRTQNRRDFMRLSGIVPFALRTSPVAVSPVACLEFHGFGSFRNTTGGHPMRMKTTDNERNFKRSTQTLLGTPEQVFPLLCPVREYEWLEDWHCNLIYTESGIAELDCIFTTEFPGEGGTETWVVSDYVPSEKIEFVRFNSLRTIRYTIRLEPDGSGTKAVWEQVITGLNEAGNEWVRGYKDEKFEGIIRRLEKQINHFLTTGRMLKGAEVEVQA